MQSVVKDVIKEESKQAEFDREIFIKFFKVIFECIRFGFFLVISILKILIKLIEKIFFLKDYKPFKFLSDAKEKIIDKKAADNINKERMRFAVTQMTMHKFEFNRSVEFSNNYKVIQKRIKECTDLDIRLNDDLYKDTLRRIDIIVVEAEKEALREGYAHAKEMKYRVDEEKAYEDFIKNKIMKGEGIPIYGYGNEVE